MSEFRAKFIPAKPGAELRSLIARGMDSRARPEDFIALFQPDAVLHMVGDRRQCTFFGDYRGRAEILELLRAVDAEFERRDHRLLNLVIDGECCALRRLVEIKHRGSAQTGLVVIGHYLRTRAGLISEVFEYSDTATILRLMS